MKKHILVTGGAGYIGSHMSRLLLDEGYSVVVFDNLSTGYKRLVAPEAVFVKGDLCRDNEIEKVFTRYKVEAVMHFCASIQVGESVKNPIKYYENNIGSAIALLKAMFRHRVKKIIFSSTAAVYGDPVSVPIGEDAALKPVNPYGKTKLTIEELLADIAAADPAFEYSALRYFNACGAHPNGRLGEMHNPETHLIPNILKAIKDKKEFTQFGNDYPTPDGTCIRDYIHVMDLCRAHLLALKAFDTGVKNEAFNLGSGSGYSISEVVSAAEAVTGKKVKIKLCPRRAGDPPRLVASSAKAKKVLGWQPRHGLTDILETAWAWGTKQG